jgi:hypothetical protein
MTGNVNLMEWEKSISMLRTLVSLMSYFQDTFLETERRDICIPYRTSVRSRPISGKYKLVFDGVENTMGLA